MASTSKCRSMFVVFLLLRERDVVCQLATLSPTFSLMMCHVVSRSQLHIIVANVMLPLWLNILQSDAGIKVSKMMTSQAVEPAN